MMTTLRITREFLFARDRVATPSDASLHSFNHPSTYKEAPIIWIPRDGLGMSKLLVKELIAVGVKASDVGAFMDERGNVNVLRNPPDQQWVGGNDQ